MNRSAEGLHRLNEPDRVRREIEAYVLRHPTAPTARLAALESPGMARQFRRNDPIRGSYDLVIKGKRVLVDGAFGPWEVAVQGGKICQVRMLGSDLHGAEVVTLEEDEVLIPGLVDGHVHVNEPGRTSWEGFASATRAAAAGGVTTIVDMPLNSIPSTVSIPALELKQLHAAPQLVVDAGFWGGAVPGNQQHLPALHQAGVVGFKCFLSDSGVAEFPPLRIDQLEDYLSILASFDALMCIHAEVPYDSSPPTERSRTGGAAFPDSAIEADYANFLALHPVESECEAIAAVIAAMRRTGARCHILHLSAAEALPMIAEAKSEGLDLTVETCPHYLVASAEEILPGDTLFKCCPPIRASTNADRLWRGLEDGVIDYVASDHSPSTMELKAGGFAEAWGGIASLQLSFPLIWTAAQQRGIDLAAVITWMSTKPAERLRLVKKGRIAPECDADLVIVAPAEASVVDEARLHHKNPQSPYRGRSLLGSVRATFVGGDRVTDSTTPRGRFVLGAGAIH